MTGAIEQNKSGERDRVPAMPSLHWAKGAGILLSLYAFLTLPLILFTKGGGYNWDERNWHIPSVLMIRDTWPTLNLNEVSLSAVSPGYHYFLATVSFLTGTEITVLRLVNWFISALLLLILYRWVRRWVGTADSLLLIFPLAASNFYVKASCWIVSDNAALLLATVSCIGLFSPVNSATRAIQIGILATAATFVRQSNVWLAAPLWIQAAFFQCRTEDSPGLSVASGRRGTLIALALSGSMPVMVLIWLWSSWGGLVPPTWRAEAIHPASSAIAYLLAVAAMIGIPYLGFLTVNPLRELPRHILFVAVVVGIASAVASPTSYSYEYGRWGGYLWEFAKMLPAWSERAPFFLLASPLGAIVIATVYWRLRQIVDIPSAIVWLSIVLAWASTFVPNRQVFHRYYEPMLIVLFVLAAAPLSARTQQNGVVGRRLLLTILCIFQIALTLATAWKAVSFF